MYGIFTTIYPINGPNVSIYTIHGSYGVVETSLPTPMTGRVSVNSLEGKFEISLARSRHVSTSQDIPRIRMIYLGSIG